MLRHSAPHFSKDEFACWLDPKVKKWKYYFFISSSSTRNLHLSRTFAPALRLASKYKLFFKINYIKQLFESHYDYSHIIWYSTCNCCGSNIFGFPCCGVITWKEKRDMSKFKTLFSIRTYALMKSTFYFLLRILDDYYIPYLIFWLIKKV